MKNTFTFKQTHLSNLSLYMWLSAIVWLGGSWGCKANKSSDNIEEIVALTFEKLSYDRANSRIVVVIKNTSNAIAKGLSLRCTNISQDLHSQNQVLINTQLQETIIALEELPNQSSSKEIYVTIDYQAVNSALVQIELKSGEQVIATQSIEANLHPIQLIPIGSTVAVKKQEESATFKYKLVTDEPVDFSLYRLEIYKEELGKNIEVSIEDTNIVLNAFTDSQTVIGADLEKLAQQNEILAKVTNNSADPISIITELIVNDTNTKIATINNELLATFQDAFLPAAAAGDLELLQEAMNAFTDKATEINMQDGNGYTALQNAAWYNHLEVVKELIKNGADVNIKDNEGNTALHGAIKNGYSKIASTILEHGAKVDEKDNEGKTVLHLAAQTGQKQDVEVLIKYKTNLNERDDKHGATALHFAVIYDHQEIVQQLLQAGADKTLQSNNGKTAAGVAKATDIQDLINNWGR